MGLGQAPTNVLGLGSGTTRAKGLPRFRTWTTSPASSHLEIRLNSLRRSRTVAVFISDTNVSRTIYLRPASGGHGCRSRGRLSLSDNGLGASIGDTVAPDLCPNLTE